MPKKYEATVFATVATAKIIEMFARYHRAGVRTEKTAGSSTMECRKIIDDAIIDASLHLVESIIEEQASVVKAHLRD